MASKAKRSMGRAVVVSSIMALGLGVAGVPSVAMAQQGPTPRQMQPKMAYDVQIVDFGVIPDTELVYKEFELRNEGAANLEIKSLQASCGCTRPEIDREVLRPGDVAVVKVGFKPFGRSGVQNQRITISTNDPERPTAIVRVRADVQPRMFIEPKVLQFASMARGESKTVTMKVSGRESNFEITDIKFPARGDFSYEIEGPVEVNKGGVTLQEYTVNVSAGGDLEIGRSNVNVLMLTNDPLEPRKNVRASITVLGDMIATPPRVGLRSLRAGDTFTSQVRVTNRQRKPFEIRDVIVRDVSGSTVEVEVVKLDEYSYRLNLSGKATETGRFVRGNLLVQTDIEGEETLEVQYFGTLIGGRR